MKQFDIFYYCRPRLGCCPLENLPIKRAACGTFLPRMRSEGYGVKCRERLAKNRRWRSAEMAPMPSFPIRLPKRQEDNGPLSHGR
jgi:hypothetical protein